MITWLSTDQVAEHLLVPRATLDRWAYRGEGPPFRKIGKYRRYPLDELQRWEASRPAGGSPVRDDGPCGAP